MRLPFAEANQMLDRAIERLKHGEHDQQSHGRGGGAGGAAGAAGGISRGTHVKPAGGSKPDNDTMISEFGKVDKKHGGKLSKILEKNPVSISTEAPPRLTRQASGTYDPNSKTIRVREKKSMSKLMPEKPEEAVGIESAQKKGKSAGKFGSSGQFVNQKKAEAAAREHFAKVVATHELGHHVSFATKRQGSERIIQAAYQADRERGKVSKYANTHFEEYFAESFAAFQYEPKRLTPTAKKMVQDVMKLSKEM